MSSVILRNIAETSVKLNAIKQTQELRQPRVDGVESTRHRADAVTGKTSRTMGVCRPKFDFHTGAIGAHAKAAAQQFDVLADALDAKLADAEREAAAEAHAAATDASSWRPSAPTEDEEFEAIADGLNDADRDIAEDEREIERLLSPDSAVDDEQEAFAALADGVDDVDESPPPLVEQEEFAALAEGLGE